MHDNLRLLTVIAKAALIVTIGCSALLCVALVVSGAKDAMSYREQVVLGAFMAFLPVGIAAWWMLRKLQARYTRGESRSVAIAFAGFTPFVLVVSMVVAQILGGYASLLGGPFALVGVFVGIVGITTFLSFVPCMLALRSVRHTEAAHREQ